MQWIAPSEKDTAADSLEKRLWDDVKHGGQVNSYYDDPHSATGRFDFVLANPPFNVNAVDKERLKDSVGPIRAGVFPLGCRAPTMRITFGLSFFNRR